MIHTILTKTETRTLCTLLFLIGLCAVPAPSYCEDDVFKIFKVEESIHVTDNVSKPAKDFYINGGADDGLNTSMVLDVYREKVVSDPYNEQDIIVSVLVGKLKVFKLYKKVAVTRIVSLTSSDDTPVLKYRTVMIGDFASIIKKQAHNKNSDKILTSKGTGVLLPSNVLFELNDWKLRPDASAVLSKVHAMFNKLKDKDILIEGHTCSLGPAGHNMELSRKRAQSVADYLIDTIDIPPGKVQVKYYGEQEPFASNMDKEGRIKNRRVEIHFLNRDKTASLKN